MIKTIRKMDWRTWVKGLVAAAVAGGGSALGNIVSAQIIDPQSFQFDGSKLWKLAGIGALVNALIGIGLYLKQSPLPAEVDLQVEVTAP